MQKDKNYEQGAEFKHRNAAQANFGQYFPVIMLILGLLEANAVLSERYLLVVATVITALRIMHTLQLAFPDQLPIGFRLLGFMGTMAFFAIFSVLCILVGLQEFGVIDRNLLGNNRSWLGFADDKYAQVSENVKSGWNTIKDKAQDL
ncbi:g4270 [Coccomyxa elongata]